MTQFINIIAIGLVAGVVMSFGLLCLYVVLAIPARWYSTNMGEHRKREKGHELPTRVRRVNWLYALLCGYYWAPCPRCARMYGGHETGGSMGGLCTCDRCQQDSGWFPYGQDTSRYYDGKNWVGEPTKAAYFDLNKNQVSAPKKYTVQP